MSVNVTNKNKKNIKTPSSSILLKKAKKPTSTVINTAANETTKKNRSSSFGNRIQAAGLSLVASVSKRRPKPEATTTLNQSIAIDSSSSTSLPNPTTSNISSNTFLNSRPGTPRLLRLRPSISARPFSQFFFPVKEESTIAIDDDEEEQEQEQPGNVNLKHKRDKRLSFLESQTPLSQLRPHQQQQAQQQQQQQQQQQPNQQQQTNQRIFKRHSLALDFVDRQQKTSSRSSSSSSSTTLTDVMAFSSSSNSSSRSSSLKTIRNQQPDIIAVADENAEEHDTFQFNTRPISDTIMADKKYASWANTKEKRLSGVVNVARARTVLGFDSLKSRETRAIHVWRETVSQLLISSTPEDQSDSDDTMEIYKIMTHPALIPEDPLERQRFVRPLSPKSLAMTKFILNELSETERSYNQLLKLIQDRYMKPMIAASKAKNSLVKSTDIPLLFNHLPELVHLSDKLLDLFESTNNIGQVFRSLEPCLVVFLKYAMHYRTNIKTIRRACSNVLFVKIDQENLSRRDTNRLGMSDYFIAPIQRIPRYCLLLKDLQKYTNPMDANHDDLDKAIKVLTGLAMTMDHVQSKTLQQPRSPLKTL